MTHITIYLYEEHGESKILDVVVDDEDNSIRLIDPDSDPTADALYVGDDWDDLLEQISRDGHYVDLDRWPDSEV